MKGLNDKVAIVTGAATGIGQASAMRFAVEGTRVICADADVTGGRETIERINAEGGEATFVQTDVSDAAAVQSMVETAVDTYGRLDFAHNNAGTIDEPAALPEVDEDDWDRVMGVNLKGVYLGMKNEIPYMLENDTGGAIVNTSSKAGQKPFPFNSAYAASKHGVIGVSKAAAYEFAMDGIRVNALCPGVTDTGTDWPESTTEEIIEGIPIGRLGHPEEQASAAVWLCSDDASFVTAATLPVDGGDLRKLRREYVPGTSTE